MWSKSSPECRMSSDKKEKVKGMCTTSKNSVGLELQVLEKERAIVTDPEETRRRRTLKLVREKADNSTWGFTLQTYGIRNKQDGDVEVMTYVDYVEINRPAWIAGMRKGDVLLSVNGESVEGLNHRQLVEKIQQNNTVLRLVVLFENCSHKVDLYERFIKLKGVLALKREALKKLELEESRLLSGESRQRLSGLSLESLRSSVSSWDLYSVLGSPTTLASVPTNQNVWRSASFRNGSDSGSINSEVFGYPQTDSAPSSSSGSGESTNSSTASCDSCGALATSPNNNSSCTHCANGVCPEDDSTQCLTETGSALDSGREEASDVQSCEETKEAAAACASTEEDDSDLTSSSSEPRFYNVRL